MGVKYIGNLGAYAEIEIFLEAKQSIMITHNLNKLLPSYSVYRYVENGIYYAPYAGGRWVESLATLSITACTTKKAIIKNELNEDALYYVRLSNI